MIFNLTNIIKKSFKGAVILICANVLNTSCTKPGTNPSGSTTSYQQVNLVADTAGFTGARIDPMLKNAWGIAIGSSGTFWISANHSGSTVVYDQTGAQVKSAVNIPLGANANGAAPTGVVFNTTTHFVIPGMGKSSFIYATEDGIISAWNPTTNTTTVTVADRLIAGAVYKGLASGNVGDASYIYATDFHNAKVDVYDTAFHYVNTMPFSDPNIPSGFAPFNIQNINGQLYVTYAKQKGPDNMDDQSGAGNGYVDIYTTSGTLVKRFATQGTLNSPWGIVQAPTAFGAGAGAILVGNFGDGRINIFDANGNAQGQLMNNGNALSIQGLWALSFNNIAPADPNLLYFTAGPDDENHGLFGYLKKK